MSYVSSAVKKLRYLISRDGAQLLVLEKNNGAFAIVELDTPEARDAAVTAAINSLLAGVPGALDTLNELAAALGDDANFATTITTALANRLVWKGAWAATTPYAVNDLVINNGGLYRAKTAFTSGATFNVSNWTQVVSPNNSFVPMDSTGGALLSHKRGSNGDEPGAVVVFSPDDGYTQQVADIATLNALGIPVSLNLTRNWVDQAGTNATWGDTYITTAQVLAIVNHAVGNELTYHDNGSHVSQAAYLAANGPVAFEAYVANFKAWALANFGVVIRTGAYPAGLSDPRTREVLDRQLMFMRGTKGVVSRNPPNPMDVPGIDILALTEATCKAYIDTAVSTRTILNFLWHGGADAAFRTKLTNLVAYCNSLGVPMQTFYQAMSERTAMKGTSTMVDAQGNAFHPQLRTYRLELTRDDPTDEDNFFDIDEVSNAGYLDSVGSTPFEFRKQVKFRDIVAFGGRKVFYDGVTNSTITITSATANFSKTDINKTISGAGIPVGATIVTWNSITSVDISAAATASASGVVITIGRAQPTVDFYGLTRFHGVAGLATLIQPDEYNADTEAVFSIKRSSSAGVNPSVALLSLDHRGIFLAEGPNAAWRACAVGSSTVRSSIDNTGVVKACDSAGAEKASLNGTGNGSIKLWDSGTSALRVITMVNGALVIT